MRFSGSIVIPEFDFESYSKTRQEQIQIQSRQAARKFVRAAISKIPIQTGMARGSYLNIGRLLGVAIPLSGKTRYRYRTRNGKQYREKNIWYYPPGGGAKIPKTPESGASLTAFSIEVTQGGFEFIIHPKVFHLTLQDEFHVRSPTSPWHSMKAGREAWLEEMKKFKKRWPKIGDYIIKTVISFGRGSYMRTRLRIRKNTHGE
jgi:hypothetical protein